MGLNEWKFIGLAVGVCVNVYNSDRRKFCVIQINLSACVLIIIWLVPLFEIWELNVTGYEKAVHWQILIHQNIVEARIVAHSVSTQYISNQTHVRLRNGISASCSIPGLLFATSKLLRYCGLCCLKIVLKNSDMS